MGARYYAAWLGRWTSADPMGIGAGGPGLYNYTRGSPVVFVDPGGMQGQYSGSDEQFDQAALLDEPVCPPPQTVDESIPGPEPGPPDLETGTSWLPSPPRPVRFEGLPGDVRARLQAGHTVDEVRTGVVIPPAADESSVFDEVLEGDFYEGQRSLEGSLLNVGVGLVPVVGQAADTRDTVANVLKVAEDPTSLDNWMGLGLAALAWIPLAGDLIKGGSKLAKLGDAGSGLVHMSTKADEINASGKLGLPTDLYAGPASNANRSGARLRLMTGLRQGGRQYGVVTIPAEGEKAFRSPLPLGPTTAWQRATGQKYADRGIMNVGTGAFERTGINRNQFILFSADVLIMTMIRGTDALHRATER